MLSRRIIVTLSLLLANITGSSHAFFCPSLQRTISATTSTTQVFADATQQKAVGNSHGQGSCFLPLLQNDEEYIAPRIVQVSLKNIYNDSYTSIFGNILQQPTNPWRKEKAK